MLSTFIFSVAWHITVIGNSKNYTMQINILYLSTYLQQEILNIFETDLKRMKSKLFMVGGWLDVWMETHAG